MTLKSFRSALIVIIIAWSGGYGFFYLPIQKDTILEAIATDYQVQLNTFLRTVVTYHAVADTASLDTLRAVHLRTRLAYKKIEPLLAFYEPYYAEKHLNAAPLPWADVRAGKTMVVEPVGLQVLDELLFTSEEHPALKSQTAKLLESSKIVVERQLGQPLYHQHIFQASREQLIRLYTLGLTGFDTPGSANALPEAVATLTALRTILATYHTALPVENRALLDEMDALFARTINDLTDADFATFDRLDFLINDFNALYRIIYTLHYQLDAGVYFDAPYERKSAVNYHAEQLFAADFLNPNFYLESERTTEVGALRRQLGERLFFDTRLSESGELSCASCHDPVLAFTDARTTSLANNGTNTLRNAPTLVNSIFADRYFYDLREPRLVNQIRHVVHDSLEFATDFTKIAARLSVDSQYVQQFTAAYYFPQPYAISRPHISNALATYLASLVDFASPFYEYVRGERAEISAAVKRGYNLFMGKAACATCHFAPTFSGTVPPLYDHSESEILGVPATADTLLPTLDTDLGRYGSGLPIDRVDFQRHAFKTVGLRHVGKTAPYMHNGVYATLEEVVDFYNRGGGVGLGLDVPNQTLAAEPLGLTETEKADLVAFLKSL